MSRETAFKKLKLYAERSSLPSGRVHTILLFPFWGNPETDVASPDYGRFDEYMKTGDQLFTIVNTPVDSDAFVLPFEFSFDELLLKEAKRLDELAGKNGKKIIVFYNSDFDEEIPLKNAVVLRTSFYRSSRKKNEFALPGWTTDSYKNISGTFRNEKPAMPEISYCGYVDHLKWKEKLTPYQVYKSFTVKTEEMYKVGPRVRGKALRALLREKNIHVNYLIRNGFWAGGMNKNLARKEYMENMLGSDYALVARGAGNFSYRLYEALSCARIPVFIDTDCVLPYDHLVDWKKHMVWINENKIQGIGKQLVKFHSQLSTSEFNALKESNRKLYEEWISPVGFFSHLHLLL
jgi:hypothetical protein